MVWDGKERRTFARTENEGIDDKLHAIGVALESISNRIDKLQSHGEAFEQKYSLMLLGDGLKIKGLSERINEFFALEQKINWHVRFDYAFYTLIIGLILALFSRLK